MKKHNYRINHQGWIEGILHDPSPHYDERPEQTQTNLLVIHNISLPPGRFGEDYIHDLFCDRLNFDAHPYFAQLKKLKVSAHLLISRDGVLTQFVAFDKRAWHAGMSVFAGRERCNDFSIGVELEGSDDTPFTEVQYRQLADVTLALLQQYPIKNITSHSHIAPGRKTDPGPAFPMPAFRHTILSSPTA